jgi:hypothetical protein
MKKLIALCAALFITACETNQQDKEVIKAQVNADAQLAQDNAERHSMRVLNNVRDQTKKTAMKMREWWLTPLPVEYPKPVPPSYCYKVWQDIVCYRDPMPGRTHELVAYQGNTVDAVPPPLAQTEPLPYSRVQKQIAATTGAERITKAKPVFDAIPTLPEPDKDAPLDATAQVGSEPLPDPALSPQL